MILAAARNLAGAKQNKLRLTADATHAPKATQVTEASKEERLSLLESLEAGTLDQIQFDAVVFRNVANANGFRFYEEDLDNFATSFEGAPFLRDHDQRHIASRDGTVIESSHNQGQGFVQQVQLTTPEGIQDYLMGRIDRFSIGWDCDGVICSICDEDWFKCWHWPGQSYEIEGVTTTAEVFFLNPVGIETSAVNVPAVPGTHILSTLSDLKKEYQEMENEEQTTKEEPTEATESAPGNEGQTTLAGLTLAAGDSLERTPGAVSDSTLNTVLSVGTEAPPEDNRITSMEQQLAAMADQLAAQAEQNRTQRIERAIVEAGLNADDAAAARMIVQGQSEEQALLAITTLGRLSDQAKTRQPHPVTGLAPINSGDMITPADRLQETVDFAMGVKDAPMPPPALRSMRDAYLYVTEDYDFHGNWGSIAPQLAGATTLLLPNMVSNALNKVMIDINVEMSMYRWYEHVSTVTPHDGSTRDITLVQLDGVGMLPTVGEGQAYSEQEMGDSAESMSFDKRGMYVGLTLEMIRKNDVMRIQAVPRALIRAAIRTRSYNAAQIFTQNGGLGPTMHDGLPLFDAAHNNLLDAALDADSWKAARVATYSQTEQGSESRLGMWPRYVLVPAELYDQSLTTFGYGQGDVGRPSGAGTAQEVNIYAENRPADPRPMPIAVPEFIDDNDWAWMVDKSLSPVMQFGFANTTGGQSFPMPEIYTPPESAQTSGLMFTNDVLPVKIRDWWSLGVATWTGVGKSNVT